MPANAAPDRLTPSGQTGFQQLEGFFQRENRFIGVIDIFAKSAERRFRHVVCRQYDFCMFSAIFMSARLPELVDHVLDFDERCDNKLYFRAGQ